MDELAVPTAVTPAPVCLAGACLHFGGISSDGGLIRLSQFRPESKQSVPEEFNPFVQEKTGA